MSQNKYSPDIFLTYANIPLDDYPQAFYKVLAIILKIEYWRNSEARFRHEIDTIIKADKVPCSNQIKKEIINNIVQKYPGKVFSSDFIIHPDQSILLAHEVYGAHLTKCQTHCKGIPMTCVWASYRKTIFETKKLKCYQCDHKYFQYLITELAEGKEYSEIVGLETLFHYHNLEFNHWTIVNNKVCEGISFKETIVRESVNNFEGLPMAFPRCLMGTVTQSLLNFLINDDRQKLKICQQCHKFFVSKKLRTDQKYCSEKCGNAARRWPKEKFRRYQQKRRKELKDQEKLRKEKKIKQKQIKRLMEAGYTREEAQKEWEARREEYLREARDFKK